MHRAAIVFSALIIACSPTPSRALQRGLETPEATLNTYVDGLKRGDLTTVRRAYNLDLTGSGFNLPGPLPITSYRITKKSVLDSAAVKRHNGRGVVPPARVGDVELEVDEITQGKSEKFWYWLRLFDSQWRIYAHTGSGAGGLFPQP